MKMHLDTIPLWDSVRLEGECPLCALRRKLELGEVERFLGASVMEPDVRILVNREGFCQKHQGMLFSAGNRLGHALMMQTHLQETRKQQEKLLASLRGAADNAAALTLKDKVNGKEGKVLASITDIGEKMEHPGCVVCESIQENMDRYLYTFFHLYGHDADFQEALSKSKGFCVPDVGLLLEKAPAQLNHKELADFCRLLAGLTEQNLSRLQEDIDWFIKKFDYRFEAEPWGNSRDAVERTVNKLNGWCVGQEPNPKE